MELLAEIKNIATSKEVANAMKLVGLYPSSKVPVKKYSMGMKQKLGIAQAIMENQSIIVLDEYFIQNGELTAFTEEIKKMYFTIS